MFTVAQLAVVAQSNDGSGSRPRKDMIEVKVVVGKATAHDFRVNINPHEKPKEVDYENEHKFMTATANVDCFEDCPFYGDSFVFAAAYRRNADSVVLVLQTRYSSRSECDLKERVTVSRKAESKLKRGCDIEILARVVNVEKEFGEF